MSQVGWQDATAHAGQPTGLPRLSCPPHLACCHVRRTSLVGEHGKQACAAANVQHMTVTASCNRSPHCIPVLCILWGELSNRCVSGEARRIQRQRGEATRSPCPSHRRRLSYPVVIAKHASVGVKGLQHLALFKIGCASLGIRCWSRHDGGQRWNKCRLQRAQTVPAHLPCARER